MEFKVGNWQTAVGKWILANNKEIIDLNDYNQKGH
jgi:hypothetical protein